VRGEFNIIVLSDRLVAADRIAIPALLATAAVHHHLIRKGLRTSSGLVVETGEAREMHHFACLAGYGAEAINPYLAFETLAALHAEGEYPPEVDAHEVVYRYIKSVGKGCSRSCPRWAFRPISPIAARKSSTRLVSRAIS
jgi:glutamate synthase (NADPH/NADH) large chain